MQGLLSSAVASWLLKVKLLLLACHLLVAWRPAAAPDGLYAECLRLFKLLGGVGAGLVASEVPKGKICPRSA
jgi:hypothetical protein